MWNPAVALEHFPLSIPQGNGFSLGPRKREVLRYKLHAVMLQAFWVGVEMERRNGMAVLICPQGTPLYDCELVNIVSQWWHSTLSLKSVELQWCRQVAGTNSGWVLVSLDPCASLVPACILLLMPSLQSSSSALDIDLFHYHHPLWLSTSTKAPGGIVWLQKTNLFFLYLFTGSPLSCPGW